MIRELNVPVRTGGELFRSYLMLEPAHAETYVAYLEGEEQWDEAAKLLVSHRVNGVVVEWSADL